MAAETKLQMKFNSELPTILDTKFQIQPMKYSTNGVEANYMLNGKLCEHEAIEDFKSTKDAEKLGSENFKFPQCHESKPFEYIKSNKNTFESNPDDHSRIGELSNTKDCAKFEDSGDYEGCKINEEIDCYTCEDKSGPYDSNRFSKREIQQGSNDVGSGGFQNCETKNQSSTDEKLTGNNEGSRKITNEAEEISDFIPNLQQHLYAWQSQIRNIQDKEFEFGYSKRLQSYELEKSVEVMKNLRSLVRDLKDSQKVILYIQQNIIETQNQFKKMLNGNQINIQSGIFENPMLDEHSPKFSPYIVQNNTSNHYSSHIDIADLINALSPKNTAVKPPSQEISIKTPSVIFPDPLTQGTTTRGKRYNVKVEENNEYKNNSFSDKKRSRGGKPAVRDETPIPGVRYAKDRNSWVAFWCEGGRQNYKSFSNKKFGHEKAKQLAIRARIAFEQNHLEEQANNVPSQDYDYSEPMLNEGFDHDPNFMEPNGEDLGRCDGSKNINRGQFNGIRCNLANTPRNELQQLAGSLENPKGVCYAPSNNTWMAYGGNSSGMRMCKSFPVHKYGFFKAREQAILALGGNLKHDAQQFKGKEEILENLYIRMQMYDCPIDMPMINSERIKNIIESYNVKNPEYATLLVSSDAMEKDVNSFNADVVCEGSNNVPLMYGIDSKNSRNLVTDVSTQGISVNTDINPDKSVNGVLLNSNKTSQEKLNQSNEHVKGVNFNRQCNTWAAIWYVNGVQQVKYFSVKQYGYDEAKRLAVEHRKKIDAHRLKTSKDKGSSRIRCGFRDKSSSVTSNHSMVRRQRSSQINHINESMQDGSISSLHEITAAITNCLGTQNIEAPQVDVESTITSSPNFVNGTPSSQSYDPLNNNSEITKKFRNYNYTDESYNKDLAHREANISEQELSVDGNQEVGV